MQHSLSDKSAHTVSVLSAWCKLPGAVPHEEIVAVFRDKSKRPKGGSSLVMPESLDITIVD